MPRSSKSQWDFGELFTPEQMRRVWTVSELTSKVRSLLEAQIGDVWVTGEISNLRVQSSGHRYFTLKDVASQLACVLFRGESVPHRNLLEDGTKVILRGDVTVYEARGQYQLIVRQVELQGVGALQAAFERLKQKLAAEGLFAPERKRLLPRFPQRVGVVTSPTAAALRDVLHVVERRNPALQLVLAPCRVQGEGAAGEVAESIRLLNQFNQQASDRSDQKRETESEIGVILITRGGGSLEDLWAFNEEVVARAIAESEIPVVSAVGHEIDFTISDFVADLRAATPSAAAEILTEGVFAATEFIRESPERLQDAAQRSMEERRDDFDQHLARLARCHPRRRLEETAQALDDLQFDLTRYVRERSRRLTIDAGNLVQRLVRLRPLRFLEARRDVLVTGARRLLELARHQWQMKQDRYNGAKARLQLLGPQQVLARGYSITMDEASGRVIRDAKKVRTGQRLCTRVQKGEIRSRVEK